MADVHGVVVLFFGLALLAALVLVATALATRRPAWWWRAVARGAALLAIGAAVVGVASLLFFDQAFTIFHEIFFAAGELELRSADRPPRPALPGRLLDRDVRRDRDRRRGADAATWAFARRRSRGDGAVMSRGLPIGRFLGSEIRVHLSWCSCSGFLTASLGAAGLPDRYPTPVGRLTWIVAAASALGLFLGVLVHEWRPSWRRPAMRRPRRRSRSCSSARPRHSKAAPGRRVRRPRSASRGPSRASSSRGSPSARRSCSAGPSPAAPRGAARPPRSRGEVLLSAGILNGLVGLLNLVPVFPLDGARILRAVAWRVANDPRRGSRAAVRSGQLVGIAVAAGGIAIVSGETAIDGMVVIFLGWFVRNASVALGRREDLEGAVAGLVVDEVMDRDLPTIPPQVTLDTFAEVLLGPGETTVLPVIGGDGLLGLVGHRACAVPARRRGRRTPCPGHHVAAGRAARRHAGDALRPAIQLSQARAPTASRSSTTAASRACSPATGWVGRSASAFPTAASGGAGSRLTDCSSRMASRLLPLEVPARRSWLPLRRCETVSLAPADALGRVLAVDVVAAADLPPWDNSAMDGYAVRAADVAGATEGEPVRLGVAGEVAAGRAPEQAVESGRAIRIATGAPVPPGTSAVVPVEDTTPIGADGRSGTRGRDASGPLPAAVLVHVAAAPGANIRARASDIAAGMRVLRAGDAIGPAAVALAAAANAATVVVRRRPRVAVLTTGDELRTAGAPLAGPASRTATGRRSSRSPAPRAPRRATWASRPDRLRPLVSRLRRPWPGPTW